MLDEKNAAIWVEFLPPAGEATAAAAAGGDGGPRPREGQLFEDPRRRGVMYRAGKITFIAR